MLQKLKFGITHFINRINLLYSFVNPRYQLSLDDDYFDIKEKNWKYRFKSFGDHSFPEFTFAEIQRDKNILFAIYPEDLIKISEKNHVQEYSKNKLKITEIMRNNLYKLNNSEDSNIFSGDEVCDNPLLADHIIKSDLFKIAYNTGFERGRRLSKMIAQQNKDKNFENNVVSLNCHVLNS